MTTFEKRDVLLNAIHKLVVDFAAEEKKYLTSVSFKIDKNGIVQEYTCIWKHFENGKWK